MRAVVLSGGGLAGSFQVGALKKLEEMGITCDCVYGVSTGALNSFGYSFGTAANLAELWLSIKSRSDLMGVEWWKLFWAKGLFNLNPLKEWMLEVAKATPRCRAVVSYADLRTGALIYCDNTVDSKEAFVDAVLASASQVPQIMPYNEYMIDGGVREQTPLKKAIDDGADKVIAILTHPFVENPTDTWEYSFPSMLSVISRATDIMSHEVFIKDIKRAIEQNENPNKKKIELQIIYPETTLIGTFEVNPSKIAASIAAGYAAANQLHS